MQDQLPLPELVKDIGHFFGVRTEEGPAYEVVEKDHDKEIRKYTAFSTAQIKTNGNYEHAMESAFHQLAEYIFGKNAREIQMKMTTPILQQRTSTGWMLSFILPSKYNAASAPTPLNSSIQMSQRPEELVASLQFSGWTNKKIIYAKTRELFRWLKRQDRYQVVSKPRAAQYDPAFALPFMRRNEVQVTVIPKNSLH